ncbi:MAG: hypothetical protein M3Q47_11655 [Actinomycetota bacterium]|nr:hypothetical protein [Actinomycetota bacterium]
MLTPADDSLWHQLPTTFDHVHTSDPRFFDRYWFAAYEPAGHGALQLTLGAYNNMDVMDAGFVVVHDGRQHNLRVSRSLRPRFVPVCGPVQVHVLRPLESFELTVDAGQQTVHGQLRWEAGPPPEEEAPHFERLRGRVREDYARFNQIGSMSGWLDVDGERVEVDQWWSCRDHSWGVRPRMGIPEPVTGPKTSLGDRGYIMLFLFFSTPKLAGHVNIAERGDEREYATATLRDTRSGEPVDLRVADVDFRLDLFPGTRRFRTIHLDVTLGDGEVLELACEALGPSIAMPGLGYSGGFRDRKGLGVWRGELHEEFETWDVSHPADVVYEDGAVRRPWHRIQPVRVFAGGGAFHSQGTGSMTAVPSGHLPQYGLPAGEEDG